MHASSTGPDETASRTDPGDGRVLVAGGTGFIGSAVVAALQPIRPVSVLTRSPERARERHGSGPLPDFRAGDVTEPASLPPALSDIDTIVHCVQFPGFPVEDPSRGRTFMEVDGRGTAAMAQAAVDAGVRKFVYLSGVGADPDSPRDWYRAKGLAERALRDSGLEYSIIRPSWTYGPGDSSLNRFVTMIRTLPLVFPQLGPGDQRINPVFIGDVGRLAARVVTATGADGHVVEIGGREIMTMDGIIRTTMQVLGRSKPIVHVPIGLAKVGAAILERLPGQLLSGGAIDFVTQSAVADLRALDERFPGFELLGFEEAARSYLG